VIKLGSWATAMVSGSYSQIPVNSVGKQISRSCDGEGLRIRETSCADLLDTAAVASARWAVGHPSAPFAVNRSL
jgi:hypothetical protein